MAIYINALPGFVNKDIKKQRAKDRSLQYPRRCEVFYRLKNSLHTTRTYCWQFWKYEGNSFITPLKSTINKQTFALVYRPYDSKTLRNQFGNYRRDLNRPRRCSNRCLRHTSCLLYHIADLRALFAFFLGSWSTEDLETWDGPSSTSAHSNATIECTGWGWTSFGHHRHSGNASTTTAMHNAHTFSDRLHAIITFRYGSSDTANFWWLDGIVFAKSECLGL